MTHLTERQREILETYADCNMNRTATARRLYMCSSNVYYCFDRIREKTNLDPRNPFDLVKLLQMDGNADCVAVIRCGKCIHSSKFGPSLVCRRNPVPVSVKRNDFCNYGVKEDL